MWASISFVFGKIINTINKNILHVNFCLLINNLFNINLFHVYEWFLLLIVHLLFKFIYFSFLAFINEIFLEMNLNNFLFIFVSREGKMLLIYLWQFNFCFFFFTVKNYDDWYFLLKNKLNHGVRWLEVLSFFNIELSINLSNISYNFFN